MLKLSSILTDTGSRTSFLPILSGIQLLYRPTQYPYSVSDWWVMYLLYLPFSAFTLTALACRRRITLSVCFTLYSTVKLRPDNFLQLNEYEWQHSSVCNNSNKAVEGMKAEKIRFTFTTKTLHCIVYTVLVKKDQRYFSFVTFAKCWSIFKILSPLDSSGNLQ